MYVKVAENQQADLHGGTYKAMISFDKMPCLYWSDSTKIGYLQRRIIVYSIMYYEQNESCVSDAYYDSISRQLVEMMQTVPFEELRKSMYYYAMYDFDGSTGFDIPSRLTKYDREYLGYIAATVHQSWKHQTTFEERRRQLKNEKPVFKAVRK